MQWQTAMTTRNDAGNAERRKKRAFLLLLCPNLILVSPVWFDVLPTHNPQSVWRTFLSAPKKIKTE